MNSFMQESIRTTDREETSATAPQIATGALPELSEQNSNIRMEYLKLLWYK